VNVQDHQGIVHKVARRFRSFCNRGLEYVDLVQAGNIGLMRAIEKFDPERAKFSTFAYWWVWHFIVREIQNGGRTVRIPVWVYEQSRRDGVDLPAPTVSLDTPITAGEDGVLSDLIQGDSIDPLEQLENDERRVYVEQQLAALTDQRQGEIIRRRFYGDQTLTEISKEQGVSRQRVRQLELTALRLLHVRCQREARDYL
jgi:RNA polymerase sigma factor (sigma-70 family)